MRTRPLPGFPSDLRDPARVAGHGTHLTRMSDFDASPGAGSRANPRGSHALAAVARCVHPFAPVPIVLFAAVLLGGCPPPPLSLDEPDARGNLPPAIESVRSETGTEFKIGVANPVIRTQSTMTLTLFDADLADTLYVRGFFDYTETDPSTARAVCEIGPAAEPVTTRSVTCNLGAFCPQSATGGRLDIVVSDREPDDAGDLVPPRWAVAFPGKQATRTYLVTCQDAPAT